MIDENGVLTGYTGAGGAVTIPASATSISNSFSMCEALATINYGGTQQQWQNALDTQSCGLPSNVTINYGS